MSVCVQVLNEDTDDGAEYYTTVFSRPKVIGRVLALVVKHPDGGITLERDIAVNADNADDNELAEATVKAIEAKLNEAFPDPNKPEPAKLWTPN